MKCTWPTPTFCVGSLILYWLALGFCVGGNANFSVLRYQHVGIPNAKFRVGGLSQRKDSTVLLRRSGI